MQFFPPFYYKQEDIRTFLNTDLSLTVAILPYGLAVRIPGFHPGGPGSTPGMGRKAVVLDFAKNFITFTNFHTKFLDYCEILNSHLVYQQ